MYLLDRSLNFQHGLQTIFPNKIVDTLNNIVCLPQTLFQDLGVKKINVMQTYE